MNNLKKAPLVSIIIVTYNSSNYVLETLDSTITQTYNNIELIITDDGSTDHTVEICEDWIERNKSKFCRIELITVNKNTGIPSNFNRGNNKAKGKWVKIIAGDDILLPNCVQDNIEFATNNSSDFVFSLPIYINDKSEILEHPELHKQFLENDSFYDLDANGQFIHLITKDIPMNPPTLFYKRKTLEEFGGFDENHKNEDYPLYLKATSLGYKMEFFYKHTVKYRIHDSSYSIRVKKEEGISYWEKIKIEKAIKPYITKKLFSSSPLVVIDYYNRLFFNKSVILLGNSKKVKSKLTFIRWFSPLIIEEKINKKFYKSSSK